MQQQKTQKCKIANLANRCLKTPYFKAVIVQNTKNFLQLLQSKCLIRLLNAAAKLLAGLNCNCCTKPLMWLCNAAAKNTI
jgi:mevalonate kinase